MQLNGRDRELTLKVVYYGPGLSGKTTNLQALHEMLAGGNKSDLMSLDTKGDRTLFFDLLPLHVKTRLGFTIKVKVFTVPGQETHEATRRIVLQGTDGICFIADSQRNQRANNNKAYKEMCSYLRENRMDPEDIPVVIQFNKRDLPDVQTDEEVDRFAESGREPVFRAVALKNEGVVETFKGCLDLVWNKLNREHQFEEKVGITRKEFMRRLFASLTEEALAEVRR